MQANLKITVFNTRVGHGHADHACIHVFHKANPDVLIVPTHSPDAWAKLCDPGIGGGNHG